MSNRLSLQVAIDRIVLRSQQFSFTVLIVFAFALIIQPHSKRALLPLPVMYSPQSINIVIKHS
jgi:hypothetical protein